MKGSRQVGRRGTARVLAICVVLAGLFLMHGSPASAANGCHGDLSASMSVPMSAGSDPGTAPPSAAFGSHEAMTHPGSGQAVRAGAPPMAHGVTCLSTPAHGRPVLPFRALTVIVAAQALAGLAGRVLVRGRATRRGPPPPGGRGLLLQVSVART
ncbi:hypothetical protein [Actinacidiphila paucisporea]|uniref:Uncharacterized protein n=1 Tax=Actinacidiphila paucisporea TaxID=310782 RepID=A0A1M7QIC2_9ACTN|nr:hypothetical protein [Actinacidiphila paucisporea]SHN30562.1 hypothetical protein SAMN05216499_1359 [Actinacidiphila paucisporea]